MSDAEAVDDGDPPVRRVRRVSHLLDDAIRLPGGYRIGIDPLVGILPVAGDLVAAVAAAYVVAEAAYAGVPKATVARMVLNVLVDTVVGSIPLVGTVFDAVWKANARNVELLESRVEDPSRGRSDRLALLGTALFLVVFVVGLSAAVVAAAVWLAGQLGLV